MGYVIEFMMVGMILVLMCLAINNIKNADNIHDVIGDIAALVFSVACLIGFVVLAIIVS
jgi:hypothetical protein